MCRSQKCKSDIAKPVHKVRNQLLLKQCCNKSRPKASKLGVGGKINYHILVKTEQIEEQNREYCNNSLHFYFFFTKTF